MSFLKYIGIYKLRDYYALRNLSVTLSLMIDDTLSWSAQIEKITKKVNSGLSIIRKLRDIVDYNTLIIIYKSIIQPHFDYCSQVWGVRVKRGNGKTETEKRKRKSGKKGKRRKSGKAEKRVKGGKAEKRVKGGKAEKRVKGGKAEKRVKGGKAEKRVKGGKKGKRRKSGKKGKRRKKE